MGNSSEDISPINGGVQSLEQLELDLSPDERPTVSFKLRVLAFIMCGLNITCQYLYYTAPISFLSNELIEVDINDLRSRKV